MNDRSKEKREWNRQNEMQLSWDHFEWLIREKLVSIDNNVRSMVSEMITVGVPQDMIADFLPQQFERLKREVVEEQSAKYDGKRRFV